MVFSLTTRLDPSLNSPPATQIHSTVLMVRHASPLSWSVTDIKNAATAAMNIPETVEIGLVPPKGSHVPPAIRNAYHPSKSVTTIEIALTEATSPTKFVGHQMRDAAVRDQLYKICLPGKSILRDYFQENVTSRRPFLLLLISFPGRPIFIQLPPVPVHVPAVGAAALPERRGRRADEHPAVPQVVGGDGGVPAAGHRAEPGHGARIQG